MDIFRKDPVQAVRRQFEGRVVQFRRQFNTGGTRADDGHANLLNCIGLPCFGFATHQLAQGERTAPALQFVAPFIVQPSTFVEYEEHLETRLANSTSGGSPARLNSSAR